LRVRRAINAALRKGKFLISSNVDAVEAFLEYSESQPNGKLPIHPAYLEVRRILFQQGSQNIGGATLDNALKIANPVVPDRSLAKTGVDKPDRDEGHSLPPRRMAASD
jgi:hypothetical protein